MIFSDSEGVNNFFRVFKKTSDLYDYLFSKVALPEVLIF